MAGKSKPSASSSPASPQGAVAIIGAKPTRNVFDASSTRLITARYDAAKTTAENASLWVDADSLSAAAANDPVVRKTIRERARYEVANNCYAKGMIRTVTNDIVGSEIQLQLGDSKTAQMVERDFMRWAKAIKLFQKLRTMVKAKKVDGEAFAILTTNPKIKSTVKLDIRLIECDMIESWLTSLNRTNEIDGIRFDSYGNPSEYRVLKQHPGDHRSLKNYGAGDWTAAKFIIHYFTEERPGQVRGVSELTPALNLYGLLRRFTIAVVNSSERAAEISAIMYTDLVPDNVSAELSDPLTVIDAVRNAIVSLPEGWKLAQMKPEQPTTTYAMFKGELINEIARALNLPFNVAAGNSSGYNYSSGRLDHQMYDRDIETERDDIVTDILDRIFFEWFDEYATRKSLTNEQRGVVDDHEWHFSGRGHMDPNKEATADDTRLGNGTLTYKAYYAKQGKDSKRELHQRIMEEVEAEKDWNEQRKTAGLDPAPYPFAKLSTPKAEAPIDDEEDPPPPAKNKSPAPKKPSEPEE